MTEFNSVVTPITIGELFDQGVNVMLVASGNVEKAYNEVGFGRSYGAVIFLQLAMEFGFEFEDPGTLVLDHFHNVDHEASIVQATDYIGALPIVGDITAPVLFHGVG